MSGVREIAFDTETTGFDARGEDRLTEIGCVELIDFLPTGKTYHTHLDPQRQLSEKVTEITGLTTEFLKGKPLFADVAEDFMEKYCSCFAAKNSRTGIRFSASSSNKLYYF